MEDDNGPPHPPPGSNYRQTTRRTNYYRRASASIILSETRPADELASMASLWACMAVHHLMLCMHNVTAIPALQSTDNNHDQFRALSTNALYLLSLAAECNRIAANIRTNIRRLIFYKIDNLQLFPKREKLSGR